MFAQLDPMKLPEVEIIPNECGIKIIGVLSMRTPSETITPYLRRVHDAAIEAGTERVEIDLTELSFMSSSSIRALVDWVEWNRTAPRGQQYVLAFVSDARITWQSTTLAVIRALDEPHVQIQTT